MSNEKVLRSFETSVTADPRPPPVPAAATTEPPGDLDSVRPDSVLRSSRVAPETENRIPTHPAGDPSEPRALPSSCAQILLVEDNPGDARLTREVFSEGRITNQLHIVPDGVEAMRFLRREGPYHGAPRPDLILLDLNLPKMDGREVLAIIKEDPSLQLIPIVVLTTSAAEQDIDTTYRLHANSFITKPVDLEQFITVVRSIETFWLTIVRLPHERR